MKICETVITSRQNKQIVLLSKLEERKHRAREGLFRLDGIKLFSEAVSAGLDIRQIFVKEAVSNDMLSLISAYEDFLFETEVMFVADELFDRVSEERAPEGLLAVAAFPQLHGGADMLMPIAADPQKRIFLLESVRDPGNLGTILRSAAAFGVDLLVMSQDCADLYNRKTVRGAMGALFRQPICTVPSLPLAIAILRQNGRRVLAAALCDQAIPLTQCRLSPRDCLIVGNEGHGLSAETIAAASGAVIIPMEETSESLNAGVAASVLMWEQYRGGKNGG